MGWPPWSNDDPEFEAQWEKFVNHTRAETITKMADSACVVSVMPKDGEYDVQLAVQIGMALLMDKPLIIVATHGLKVPSALARTARHSLEVGDVDTEAGYLELERKLMPIVKEYTTDV